MQIRKSTTVPNPGSNELPKTTYECDCHEKSFDSTDELNKFHGDIKKEKERDLMGSNCPKCGQGRLRLFEGHFGRFIGCDAYSVNKCKFKIQA